MLKCNMVESFKRMSRIPYYFFFKLPTKVENIHLIMMRIGMIVKGFEEANLL